MAGENDLDIDSFDIHVRELGFGLFVTLPQSAPKRSVPCLRVHQGSVTIFLLQVVPKALIGLSHVTIRVNDWEVLHVGFSSVLFFVCYRFPDVPWRRSIKLLSSSLHMKLLSTRSSTLTSAIQDRGSALV